MVKDAEVAEREADKALIAARNAVRDAKDHCRRLEAQALEEYVDGFRCSRVTVTDIIPSSESREPNRNTTRQRASASPPMLLGSTEDKLLSVLLVLSIHHLIPCHNIPYEFCCSVLNGESLLLSVSAFGARVMFASTV